MPADKAKPKRKNLTWACDVCKKAKVKCSGGNPCKRCQSRDITCSYSPQKKRGFAPRKRPLEDVQRSKEFHMVNVNLPPTKQARVDYTHHVAHEDYGFNLKEKLESIVEDNTESKKYLEVYGTYFHNQLTAGLVSPECIFNPTKDVHYVCRIFAYIYRLTFIEPQKVPRLQNLLFAYGNYIQENDDFDSLACLAFMTRYTLGVSSSICNEWRMKALKVFRRFVKIHNEPETFLPLYKVRAIISLTGAVQMHHDDDELLDIVQNEYIEILKLSDEEIRQKYHYSKEEFKTYWDLVGDPVFRIYYHHKLRIDGDYSIKMASPPWLTIEQAERINELIDNISPKLKVSMGVESTLPFILPIFLVLKSAVQESLGNTDECLRIARESVALVKKDLHLAQYSSFYVNILLPPLFKVFLKNSLFQEAIEINNMCSQFSTLYPRLQELQHINAARLASVSTVKSVKLLFEERVSLQQMIQSRITREFKTSIPSVLEPPLFCGPPNIFFKSPFF